MTTDGPAWRSVLDAAVAPMVVYDVHGRVIAANGAYAELVRSDRHEVLHLDVGQVTRPEDQAWTRQALMALASGEVDRFETDKVYVRSDGTEIDVHVTVVRVETDDDVYLVSTIECSVDLPASDEPRRSLADRLLDFAGESVTLLDRDLRVVYTSSPDRRDYGYPAQYWRGRDVSALFPGEEWQELASFRDHLLSSPGLEVERDLEIRRGDGGTATLTVRILNRVDDPVLRGIVVVSRDVTHERAALEELTRRRHTAEAVADAQTRLLATVSHELRNPLHAVRGIAELLAAEELSPTARELATSLERQLAGLTHVTEDLLDAARLDAGKVEINPVPTELRRLVADVVDLARAAARGKPVDVVSRVTDDTPEWVLADGDRLRQLLGNLVGNAVKFTPAGDVQLVVRRSGGRVVVFSVIDSGVGIPPGEHATVLQPFAVASTAGDSRGAGLGLAIVHRLTIAMDGRLELSSEVGRGTRFDVELPLVTTTAPVTATAAELPAGLRVLVVEDNPVNQQLATRQLERLGLAPEVVSSGEDALTRLTDRVGESIDVVLMDEQMPGWSGTETTAMIRSDGGPAASVPIIGLSASASAAEIDRFIEAGMTDFLAKPASIRDLADAIGRAIAGHATVPATPDRGPAVPVPGDETSVTDLGVLAALATELGDEGVVAELVLAFLGELDGRVAAIVDPDPETSYRAAHTLKSSARLLGAASLGQACAAIEQGGAVGHAGGDDIVQLAAATRRELESWLASHGRSGTS